jgi:hypothetical protein
VVERQNLLSKLHYEKCFYSQPENCTKTGEIVHGEISMGDAPDPSLVPIKFQKERWAKLNALRVK